jgi:hypothetical protein
MRRSTMFLVLAVAWSPLLCAQAPAPAQQDAIAAKAAAPAANLRGFTMGIDPLVGAALTSDGITGGRSVNGLGLALRFGWGFSERWALLMDVAVTDLVVADSAGYFLSHGDVLLRWTPFTKAAPGGVWAPFLQGGFGFRDVTAEKASPTNTTIYMFEGEVLTLGAGVAYFVSPGISISTAFMWSTGDFNDERIGMVTTHGRGVPGTSARIGVGVNWHKGRAAVR